MKKIKAPEHLRAPTQAWFLATLEAYECQEHHVRILTLAGQMWDRAEQARETIAAEGATYSDRFGAPRPHPSVGIERDSVAAFVRCVRELGLDAEPPPEAARPPQLRHYTRPGA